VRISGFARALQQGDLPTCTCRAAPSSPRRQSGSNAKALKALKRDVSRNQQTIGATSVVMLNGVPLETGEEFQLYGEGGGAVGGGGGVPAVW
jgi:hypothetical protein